MTARDTIRRLRGALGNALIWGAGWSVLAFVGFGTLRLAGIFSPEAPWTYVAGLALRAGMVGFFGGAAFSALVRLLYHGRRLSEINWVRFGIGGGIATGVFVPLFLQAMNLLSGDGLVPWNLVLDDAVWTAAFGAVVSAGSLKLAQRAQAALPGRQDDCGDGIRTLERQN